MHAPHTDVPMGDVTYRIGRFYPHVGSFISFQMTTKVMPAFLGGGVAFKGIPIAIGGSPLTEEEFYTIQNHCLAVCSVLNEHGVPSPIRMKDGRLDPRIADDFPAVLALTIHTLKFNIERFFSEGNPAMASLASLFAEAQSSPTSQPSTDSSGAQ